MKDILIVLLVIAVALLIIGAANNDQRVDLDYVFGTWHQVSLFTLIAIAAAALVVVGLTAAAFAALGAAGDRRKLERELEQTYGRLREAEAHAAQMAEEAAAASAARDARSSRWGWSPARRRPPGSPTPRDRTTAPRGRTTPRRSAATTPPARAADDDAAGSDDRTRALRQQTERDDT